MHSIPITMNTVAIVSIIAITVIIIPTVPSIITNMITIVINATSMYFGRIHILNLVLRRV